jgi:hypothetical protein
MLKNKLEVLVIELAQNENGFNHLGQLSAEAYAPLGGFCAPNVGETVVFDFPSQNFSGLVTHKTVVYGSTDLQGAPYSLVTRIFLTIDRGIAQPGFLDAFASWPRECALKKPAKKSTKAAKITASAAALGMNLSSPDAGKSGR